MSRYILVFMSVLAISACTDNRPYDTKTQNSGSTLENRTDSTNNTTGSPQYAHGSTMGNTTDAPMNKPSQTNRVAGPGMNDDGSDGPQSTNRTGASPVSADRGDRTESTLTAGDQSESEADRQITKQIRQAVVADPSLSIKAKNSTIITIGGIVTLRGSVDTAAERMSVGNKADRVSGVRRVDNNLEIIR